MGLDGMPTAIGASGGKLFFTHDDQEWPDTLLVQNEYPGKVLQYEMRVWSRPKLFGATEGAVVHGENGWMLLTNTSWKAFDAADKLVCAGRDKRDPGPAAQYRNFLDAVRSRKRESLNQEIASGHVSTAMCHAGHVAWRMGKKLRFDARSETFDDPEANHYIGRKHRKGFRTAGRSPERSCTAGSPKARGVTAPSHGPHSSFPM